MRSIYVIRPKGGHGPVSLPLALPLKKKVIFIMSTTTRKTETNQQITMVDPVAKSDILEQYGFYEFPTCFLKN